MKKAFLIALTLFISESVLTQTFEASDPAAAGFNPDRLGRIDDVINNAIEKGEIPGAVALVARDGKIAYHKEFGFADVDNKKLMELNSIFRIASMTKAITSVGVMILYERGHFLLNDPVSEYLPEFANAEVIVIDEEGNITGTKPAENQIKIIDLLTHSSGLAYSFIPSKLQDMYKENGIIDGLTIEPLILKDVMTKLARMPLHFEPGSAFKYGLSTDVLGYLIEQVSGKPLDRFFRDEIFSKLEMEDTYFYLPKSKADRLVTLYSWVEDKGLVTMTGTESAIKMDPNYPIFGAKTYFSGGGGLSSTAFDYAKFLQMMANEGSMEGNQIISRKSVELMSSPYFDWDKDGTPDFGLGFQVISDIVHTGELGSNGTYRWGGAFYTSYWIDPEENIVAVFMSQLRPDKSDAIEKFKVAVYQALK